MARSFIGGGRTTFANRAMIRLPLSSLFPTTSCLCHSASTVCLALLRPLWWLLLQLQGFLLSAKWQLLRGRVRGRQYSVWSGFDVGQPYVATACSFRGMTLLRLTHLLPYNPPSDSRPRMSLQWVGALLLSRCQLLRLARQ